MADSMADNTPTNVVLRVKNGAIGHKGKLDNK